MSAVNHDQPVDPGRVAAARAGVLSAADAGRLAGLLGGVRVPGRDRRRDDEAMPVSGREAARGGRDDGDSRESRSLAGKNRRAPDRCLAGGGIAEGVVRRLMK